MIRIDSKHVVDNYYITIPQYEKLFGATSVSEIGNTRWYGDDVACMELLAYLNGEEVSPRVLEEIMGSYIGIRTRISQNLPMRSRDYVKIFNKDNNEVITMSAHTLSRWYQFFEDYFEFALDQPGPREVTLPFSSEAIETALFWPSPSERWRTTAPDILQLIDFLRPKSGIIKLNALPLHLMSYKEIDEAMNELSHGELLQVWLTGHNLHLSSIPIDLRTPAVLTNYLIERLSDDREVVENVFKFVLKDHPSLLAEVSTAYDHIELISLILKSDFQDYSKYQRTEPSNISGFEGRLIRNLKQLSRSLGIEDRVLLATKMGVIDGVITLPYRMIVRPQLSQLGIGVENGRYIAIAPTL